MLKFTSTRNYPKLSSEVDKNLWTRIHFFFSTRQQCKQSSFNVIWMIDCLVAGCLNYLGTCNSIQQIRLKYTFQDSKIPQEIQSQCSEYLTPIHISLFKTSGIAAGCLYVTHFWSGFIRVAPTIPRIFLSALSTSTAIIPSSSGYDPDPAIAANSKYVSLYYCWRWVASGRCIFFCHLVLMNLWTQVERKHLS